MRDLHSWLRTAHAQGRFDLPLPGSGATPRRLASLYEFGTLDLSFARLAEAHTDATAILAEAGCAAPPDKLFGVWASESPDSELRLGRSSGGMRLDGCKKYCSGAALVDSALVTARGEEGVMLIAVDLERAGIAVQNSTWATPAFAATCTATVNFDDVAVAAEQVVGPANWYLERVGFWHGAVGPAACWAGGARGLVDAARALRRRDAHSKAQLGALEADDWGARALLHDAGRQIDEDADDAHGAARTRALSLRHLIERLSTDVLDRFGRATGPQLLAFDADVARRHAELSLYIRQCHAERDLESLADLSGRE